jgi:hypothetical protein
MIIDLWTIFRQLLQIDTINRSTSVIQLTRNVCETHCLHEINYIKHRTLNERRLHDIVANDLNETTIVMIGMMQMTRQSIICN